MRGKGWPEFSVCCVPVRIYFPPPLSQEEEEEEERYPIFKQARFVLDVLKFRRGDQPPGAGPASKAIFLISKRIAIRVHSSWTQFGGNGGDLPPLEGG